MKISAAKIFEHKRYLSISNEDADDWWFEHEQYGVCQFLKIESILVCHECTVERLFSYLTEIASNHSRN
jgi:hypothetical protein